MVLKCCQKAVVGFGRIDEPFHKLAKPQSVQYAGSLSAPLEGRHERGYVPGRNALVPECSVLEAVIHLAGVVDGSQHTEPGDPDVAERISVQ